MTIKHHLIGAAIAVATISSSCAGHDHEKDPDHEHGHNQPEQTDRHEHGTDDIVLDHHTAERFGVRTETVTPGDFTEVIRVTGQVIRSASSAGSVIAPVSGTVTFAAGINPGSHVRSGATVARVNAGTVAGGNVALAAQAELDAARRELDRIAPLYADRLVTAAEYNAAVAAHDRALAAVSPGASAGTATAPLSGTITEINAPAGGYVNAGDPIATVAADNGAMVLRADVPERHYRSLPSVTDARFRTAASPQAFRISDLGGHRMGGSVADATTRPGYVPVYFSFSSNDVAAGTSADVYLLGANTPGVIAVPREALSEQQGSFYVYELIGGHKDAYRKVKVQTGASDGERVTITSGLKGGETIVTAGTTTVRLAEVSGTVPEGHSHNH